MIPAILAFIGSLPGMTTVISAVLGKMWDAKVAITSARLGVDRDAAVRLLQSADTAEALRVQALGVFSASKVLLAILVVFALPIAAYEWKVVFWDNILGWGSTPAIRGDVADWMKTIIGFLFGSSTALAIGHLWFNRKTS